MAGQPGRHPLGVAAERAYEERQHVIEKVTRELAALKEAGKFVGRIPFGFTTEGDKYDRRLVPTEEGRKHVPLVFGYVIDGWTADRIAEWLTREGIRPASGTWWPRNISNLIRNPPCSVWHGAVVCR